MQLKRILILCVVLVVLVAGQVIAQTTGGSSFTPATLNTPTSNFALIQPNALTMNAGLCGLSSGAISAPLVDLTSSSSGTGSLSCKATDAKTCIYSTPVSPTCPNNTSVYPKSIFDTAECQAQKDASCASLKATALGTDLSQLNCISGQEAGVENQINQLRSAWQTNLTQMQNNVASIDAVVKDRQTQMGFLNTKLTGSATGSSKGGGTGGLLGIQAQFQQYYGTIQTDELGLTQGYTALQNEQATMQENIQSFEMGKAQNCMNTAAGQYHCQLNGPPCSLVQYIEAVYYSLNRSQPSSNQNQAQSQSTLQGLQALLNTIFGNMSNQTQLNITTMSQSSAQQLIQQQGSVTGLMSPADILNQYGSQLAAFNIGPLNVQQVFLSGFETCYEAAQNAVGAEESQPGTAVYNYFQQVSNDSSKFRASVDQFTSKYSDVYNSFWTTLGMTGPVNATTCMAGATSTTGKMTCASDLTTNFEGLYTGTSPNSEVNISVPGVSTAPPTTFTINCYGVNGCVTQFQNAITNVGQEMTRLDSVKVGYIQQANSAIQTFAQNMSSQLSTQTRIIQSSMLSLQSQLSALGVNLTNPPNIQSETLTKSQTTNSQGATEDGLYNMPNSLLAVIGGGATPPLLDMSQGGFSQAIGTIQQQQTTDQGQVSEANNLLSQMKAAATTCQQQIQQNGMNALTTQATNLISQCDQNYAWCSQDSKSALQNLMDGVNQISGNADPSAVDGILGSGINKCQTTITQGVSGNQYSTSVSTINSMGPEAFCQQDSNVNTAFNAWVVAQRTQTNALNSNAPAGSSPVTFTLPSITSSPAYNACLVSAKAAIGNYTGQQNITSCEVQTAQVQNAINTLGGGSGNANSGLGD